MKLISLLLVMLILFNCEHSIGIKENNHKPAFILSPIINQKPTATPIKQLNDSTLNLIIASSKWFESWKWDKKKLKSKEFNLEWEKDLSIVWIKYNPKNRYIQQYDSLLIYNLNKDLALDIYSYNTMIDKKNTRTIVEFGVDLKVYIVDKDDSLRAELITCGSYEIIEDALWINNKKIVLLGYIHEDKNTPFLWLIDLDMKKLFAYRYLHSFKEMRKNYFFTKYPNTVLKME